MKRIALIAGLLSILTVTGGFTLFASAATPYSASAVALIGIGYLASSVTALVGWLLVRAPWGRWSLIAASALGVILASTSDATAVFGLYATGAASIIVLSGPWLVLWVRQHPPPGGPNRIALALIAAAPLSPLVVGIGAYDSSHWSHWVAAITGSVASWAYGRGLPLAIWLLRIAVPVASLAAFLTAPVPSSLVLAAGAVLVTGLAWTPSATQTSTFPNPPLPSPRRSGQRHDLGNLFFHTRMRNIHHSQFCFQRVTYPRQHVSYRIRQTHNNSPTSSPSQRRVSAPTKLLPENRFDTAEISS